MNNKYVYVFITLLAFLFFCNKKTDKRDIVARVDGSVLTIEDIKESFPSEYSSIITKAHYEEFVQRWIEDELLYKEALKRKLHRLPDIKKQIKKAQRNILIAHAISSLCSNSDDISESEISQYYDDHEKDFIRKEKEVRIIYMLLPNLKKARSVRNKINRSNFIKIAREYSISPITDPAKVPYITANDMSPELVPIVFNTPRKAVTQPIKTSVGYYIVKVLDKKRARSLKALPEVREEIISRLTAIKHKTKLMALVKKLKSNTDTGIYLNNLKSLYVDNIKKTGIDSLAKGDTIGKK